METLASDKHSSLLDPFLSYEEMEVLWIRLQGPYPQQSIFFITYEFAYKAVVFSPWQGLPF
jgi:hypothetical protein